MHWMWGQRISTSQPKHSAVVPALFEPVFFWTILSNCFFFNCAGFTHCGVRTFLKFWKFVSDCTGLLQCPCSQYQHQISYLSESAILKSHSGAGPKDLKDEQRKSNPGPDCKTAKQFVWRFFLKDFEAAASIQMMNVWHETFIISVPGLTGLTRLIFQLIEISPDTDSQLGQGGSTDSFSTKRYLQRKLKPNLTCAEFATPP